MELQQRQQAFVQLGKVLKSFEHAQAWPGYESGLGEHEFEEFKGLIGVLKHRNGWFTEDMVRKALGALGDSLSEEALGQWLESYQEQLQGDRSAKTVGVIMAGNIPMVGFHDMLCVLMAGHKVKAKCSSEDDQLLPKVVKFLLEIAPDLKECIEFCPDRLGEVDAVIATGSNNTSRYFEYYFGKYPNIIRKHRTSVAVLDGSETEEELQALGEDIFSYYGLGCRNVSKLFLPKGFELDRFFNAIFSYGDIINHQKYANNFDYNKTLYLMNQEPLLENGFLLLKEDEALSSPVAVLLYEYYEDRAAVESRLKAEEENIQCIVSKEEVPFGQAQHPSLSDYADKVDTMEFLLKL